MRLFVLGCYGGSAPGMRPTSFLVNESVAIDAGALTEVLPVRKQKAIKALFLSHAHLDHLVTLPFLMDNLFSDLEEPLALYGPEQTLCALKDHLFNNLLWPDFTAISNDRSPLLDLRAIRPMETVRVEGLAIRAAPMDHTVESYGYLLEDGESAVFISGDTRSMDSALPLLGQAQNLKAIVLEASFPNRMAGIASLSRHLCTATFAREAAKLPKGVAILATHMKPECLEEIDREIRELDLDKVSLLEQGRTYTF